VVVASVSSAGGLKNALLTGCWLAVERSGRSSGSGCGVARNRREQSTLIRGARRGINRWLSHEEGFVFIIGIDPHKGSHAASTPAQILHQADLARCAVPGSARG
jgi:hypothetical protein